MNKVKFEALVELSHMPGALSAKENDYTLFNQDLNPKIINTAINAQ
jgi:hypothetical protein